MAGKNYKSSSVRPPKGSKGKASKNAKSVKKASKFSIVWKPQPGSALDQATSGIEYIMKNIRKSESSRPGFTKTFVPEKGMTLKEQEDAEKKRKK
jgi:hypothetical protein